VGRRASWNFANTTQVIAGRIRTGGREIDLYCTHWTVAAGAAAYAREGGCRARTAEGLPDDERRLAREAHAEAAHERSKEAAGTLAWMGEISPPGRPAILMGDLNAPPAAAEIALLGASGWIDCFGHLHPEKEGATWDQGRNGLIGRHYPASRLAQGVRERLDYIFVNGVLGGASVREAQVVFDGRDGRPEVSDHYGLLCEIAVTPV
jgi:exonuclease III